MKKRSMITAVFLLIVFSIPLFAQGNATCDISGLEMKIAILEQNIKNNNELQMNQTRNYIGQQKVEIIRDMATNFQRYDESMQNKINQATSPDRITMPIFLATLWAWASIILLHLLRWV